MFSYAIFRIILISMIKIILVIYVIKVIVRTSIMYVFVILGVRLMGKRQIGDMQPSELVITLLISEIAAIPLQDFSQPVSVGLIAIFTLVFLEIIASVLIMKNLHIRRAFSGKSVAVIKNGLVDQKAMKSVRMTVFDLAEMLRLQGIFSFNEVEAAILEVNGSLSVCQKGKYKPPTAEDLKIEVTDEGVSMPVISDGKIIDSSLTFLGKTRSWLIKYLEKNSIDCKDIFIMTLNKKGERVIIRKEKGI